ncbi:glycosyltransferase family 39 protein [Telmatocola sphagniphila]|uniref:Glycosyltransferase family 39 protein n=1 Tax=Telmatocola sphagniphila TaxID=1123043 RepID=A0A8E6EU93_9BACT|nr:glycosyltransferase family 39 protein [Telmatocola sphagniphila]QVL33424.1 glycosyltransferase family 39 protein [Telmatocola sphagniphila]
MILGLIPRIWCLTHTEVAARDSIGFIRSALEMESPPVDYRDTSRHFTRAEVLQYTLQPPGYPAWLLLISQPVRSYLGTTPDSMVLSAQLATILASLLLVIPMYFLGKRVFGQFVALFGTALFQVLPVIVQLTSDGLSESLFLLFAITAVWNCVLALETQKIPFFAGAGASIGLSYLVRPEGLIIGVALLIAVVVVSFKGETPFKKWVIRSVCVALSFAVVAGPYVATIGGLTNKTTGKGLIHYIQGQEVDPTWQNRPDEIGQRSQNPTQLFAVFSAELNGSTTARAFWALKGIGIEVSKVGFYLPFTLAVLGFIIALFTPNKSEGSRFLLLLILCHFGLLFLLAFKIGYISERHTVLSVCIGSFFAVYAIKSLADYFCEYPKEFGKAALLPALILCLSCYVMDFRVLHANRAGHKAAGQWLAQKIQPNEVIWDPFNWAEFYAGRSLYGEPDRNPERGPVYTVIEPQHATPHSRLPMLVTAVEIMRQGEPVFHWPENKPIEQAKVAVYRAEHFKPVTPPANPPQ